MLNFSLCYRGKSWEHDRWLFNSRNVLSTYFMCSPSCPPLDSPARLMQKVRPAEVKSQNKLATAHLTKGIAAEPKSHLQSPESAFSRQSLLLSPTQKYLTLSQVLTTYVRPSPLIHNTWYNVKNPATSSWSVTSLKAIRLCTLNGWIVWNMNYVSVKLLSSCPPETLHSKDQQGEIVVLYTSLRQYIAVTLPLWARPSPLHAMALSLFVKILINTYEFLVFLFSVHQCMLCLKF